MSNKNPIGLILASFLIGGMVGALIPKESILRRSEVILDPIQRRVEVVILILVCIGLILILKEVFF